MKLRMFASYGAVAVVTAAAATMLAAGEPEVRAVETSVDWASALDWATADDAAPAKASSAVRPAAAQPAAVFGTQPHGAQASPAGARI